MPPITHELGLPPPDELNGEFQGEMKRAIIVSKIVKKNEALIPFVPPTLIVLLLISNARTLSYPTLNTIYVVHSHSDFRHFAFICKRNTSAKAEQG